MGLGVDWCQNPTHFDIRTVPLLRMLRYRKQNYKSKRNYDSVAGLQTREIVTNRDTVTLIRFFIDFEKYLDNCGFNK